LGWLLLVPHGLVGSWNAGSCCGYARQNQVDDVGFLRRLIDLVILEQSVRLDAIFVAGWSNGGFLTSLLPAALDRPLRAIAPFAGHSYDLRHLRTRGAAVLLQMSRDDIVVRYTGCCQGASCCCTIDSWGPTRCVDAETAAARYRDLNGCQIGVQRYEAGNAQCWVGVGCIATSMFCSWSGLSHREMGSNSSLCSAAIFFAGLLGETRKAASLATICSPLLPAKVVEEALPPTTQLTSTTISITTRTTTTSVTSTTHKPVLPSSSTHASHGGNRPPKKDGTVSAVSFVALVTVLTAAIFVLGKMSQHQRQLTEMSSPRSSARIVVSPAE